MLLVISKHLYSTCKANIQKTIYSKFKAKKLRYLVAIYLLYICCKWTRCFFDAVYLLHSCCRFAGLFYQCVSRFLLLFSFLWTCSLLLLVLFLLANYNHDLLINTLFILHKRNYLAFNGTATLSRDLHIG